MKRNSNPKILEKMKKIFAFMLPLMALFAGACSSSKTDSAAENSAEFTSPQPFECGEYRIDSYQFTDTVSPRERFDGRMMVALKPNGSGIYMYENGNRTHFSARITMDGGFEQKDSLFVATDAKGNEITVKAGEEIDTVFYVYKGRPVKIAFEKTPISTANADEMWRRITDKLSK